MCTCFSETVHELRRRLERSSPEGVVVAACIRDTSAEQTAVTFIVRSVNILKIFCFVFRHIKLSTNCNYRTVILSFLFSFFTVVFFRN